LSLLATFSAMRRLLPALLAASLVLGACGGDDDDEGDDAAVTSIPEETSTSTSTSTEPRTVAPDVIPQDESQITEEYVEQVLNELLTDSLVATIRAREVGLVDEGVIEVVESLNSQERSIQALNSLSETAANGFSELKTDLEPATATVRQVLEGTPSCIFAEVVFDNSGLFKNAQPVPQNIRTFARLVPASDGQRASGHNRTAWMIDALPATDDGSVSSESCSP
jgi:hypothetical protein